MGDKWTSFSLIKPSQVPGQLDSQDTKVKALVDENIANWNHGLIYQIFLKEDANQ